MEEPGGLQSMGLQSWTQLSDFHIHFHFQASQNLDPALHTANQAYLQADSDMRAQENPQDSFRESQRGKTCYSHASPATSGRTQWLLTGPVGTLAVVPASTHFSYTCAHLAILCSLHTAIITSHSSPPSYIQEQEARY